MTRRAVWDGMGRRSEWEHLECRADGFCPYSAHMRIDASVCMTGCLLTDVCYCIAGIHP